MPKLLQGNKRKFSAKEVWDRISQTPAVARIKIDTYVQVLK